MSLLLDDPPRLTTGITIFGCEEDEAALVRQLAPALGLAPCITAAPLSVLTAGLAAGHRCVSVDHRSPVSRATLGELSRLGVEYVSTRSVGCNHLDVDHARSLGITVETVAYSPDSVADYTLMLTLMVLRHTRGTLRQVEAHDYRLPQARGRELRDLTVGVVGTGRIGSAVVSRLRGFGGRTLTHDPRAGAGPGRVTLDALLAQSDVVTLHAPLTPQTHHLLDRRRIARMRPGAVVVNTGRGALLDTEALTTALEEGRLGGAALDVLEDEEDVFYADRGQEPSRHPQLARLHRLPTVVLSPHTAYRTDHALRDTVENSLLNCLHFERVSAHA